MSSHQGLCDLFVRVNRSTKSLLSRFCPAISTSLSARFKHVSWRPFEPLEPRQLLSGSIAGTAFADANNNGQLDTGEGVRSGVVVYLDQNQNAALDTGEASGTTDGSGQYSFGALSAGTYYVRSVPQTGWTATLPSSGVQSIALATDQNATQDLGHRYAFTIDNGQAGYTETGSGWTTNSTGGPTGGTARINIVGTGADTATWAFSGLTPGYYRVLTSHGYSGNRSADAPFTVYDGATSLGQVEVNQSVAPSEFSDAGRSWEELGVFQISGSGLSVTLTDGALYDDYVSADAVRVVQAAGLETPEIIDDGDLGYAQSGTWGLAGSGGYDGDGRYRVSTSGTASWTFSGLSAGYYRVEPTWTQSGSRALDVGYSVFDGTSNLANLTLNQRVAPSFETAQGQNWGNLGVFSVGSGTLKVELTGSASSSGNFIADAMRVIPVSAPDVPGVIDFGQIGYAETGSNWFHPGTPNAGVNGEYRLNTKGSGADKASWTYTNLEAGTYKVFTTWAARGDAATAAPYIVLDGSTVLGTVNINQTTAPADETALGVGWKLLGEHAVSSGTLKVEVTDNFATGTYLVADAVRIVQVSSAVTARVSGAASVAEGSAYTLNLSTSGGTPTLWSIDWGDGSDPDNDSVVGEIVSGNPLSVTHTYADGAANATVNATATIGGVGYAADPLNVQVTNVAPTVTISGESTVEEGAVYTLNLTSSDPGADTIASWNINWGDGSDPDEDGIVGEILTGHPTAAIHVFADDHAGRTITATATDEDGTFSANSLQVAVTDVAPTIYSWGSPYALEGQTYTLDLYSYDPGDDSIVNWFVTWGDGTPEEQFAGTAQSATHTYPEGPNSFTISLRGVSSDNQTVYATALGVSVENANPTATFALLTSGTITEGGQASFGFTSPADSPADLAAGLRYSFDFDANGVWDVVDATSPTSPPHTYADSGTHTALGMVEDRDGGYSIYAVNVEVATSNAAVTISGASTATQGTPYSLTLGSSDAGADTIGKWTINWGDGHIQTVAGTPEVPLTHTYLTKPSGGSTYTITANAKDEDGNYDATPLEVTYQNAAPGAVIAPVAELVPNSTDTYSVLQGSTFNLLLNFTDAGLEPAVTWDIDWGDGSNSTVTNGDKFKTHVYNTPTSGTPYTIQATVNDGTSTSTTVTAKVRVEAKARIPAAPTAVSAAVTSATAVSLSWTDASDNESGFVVEQRAGNGEFAAASGSLSQSGDAVTYAISGLTTGVAYEFRVRSTNNTGSSNWVTSNVVKPTANPPTGAPPSPPSIDFDTYYDLVWDAVSGVTEYQVEVKYPSATDPSAWYQVVNDGDMPFDSTSYIVYNTSDKWWLRPEFEIRVRSVKDGLYSSPSNVLTYNQSGTPSVPTNLTFTPSTTDPTQGTLNWDYSGETIVGFMVGRFTDPSFVGTPYAPGYPQTSQEIARPSQGTAYYMVAAVSGGFVHSGWSGHVAVHASAADAPPAAPTGLQASNASTSTVTIHWDEVSGATGYAIERRARGSSADQTSADDYETRLNLTPTLVNGKLEVTDTAGPIPYDYRVIALKNGLRSAPSQAVNATPLPMVPTELKAVVTGFDRIQLWWDDNSQNEAGFRIEKSENGGTFAELPSAEQPGAGTTQKEIAGLTAGASYTFRIKAVNVSGNSVWSGEAAAPISLPNLTADSNNDGVITAADDLIEDDPALPGNYIAATNEDYDDDGVGGLNDGYDSNSSAKFDDDDRDGEATAARLTPIVLSLPQWMDPANVTVSFDYETSGLSQAGQAGVRLWRSNSETRAEYDFIAPNTEQSWGYFLDSNAISTALVYVEALDGSDSFADRTITAIFAEQNLGPQSSHEDVISFTAVNAAITPSQDIAYVNSDDDNVNGVIDYEEFSPGIADPDLVKMTLDWPAFGEGCLLTLSLNSSTIANQVRIWSSPLKENGGNLLLGLPTNGSPAIQLIEWELQGETQQGVPPEVWLEVIDPMISWEGVTLTLDVLVPGGDVVTATAKPAAYEENVYLQYKAPKEGSPKEQEFYDFRLIFPVGPGKEGHINDVARQRIKNAVAEALNTFGVEAWKLNNNLGLPADNQQHQASVRLINTYFNQGNWKADGTRADPFHEADREGIAQSVHQKLLQFLQGVAAEPVLTVRIDDNLLNQHGASAAIVNNSLIVGSDFKAPAFADTGVFIHELTHRFLRTTDDLSGYSRVYFTEAAIPFGANRGYFTTLPTNQSVNLGSPLAPWKNVTSQSYQEHADTWRMYLRGIAF